ncbi:nucleoside phosphorylase domain-containing protein [Trichoderma pleuroticola]
MQRSPYSNDKYTIGWISALNEELILAMAMLDEEHGRPQSTPRDDTNAYHLGRIGEHNITMACLSGGQKGTGPAAIVAENMRRTFKNIRFALLVGIGGGVPGEKKDIRLGDIVVSYPNGIYTGVVQYDYGKLKGGGDVERKDWFCPPPPKILAAVDLLRAYHSRPKNPRNNIPDILNELGEQYSYPEEHVTSDLLFQAECGHNPGAETCDSCDKEALVQRRARNSTSIPHVHYGIIASGSMVVRDGVERDKIDRRYENTIFCFDMGAAGLMNNFPCLIIRGISNYSDSHKNDKWRKRAVAVASAYAKELISLIEPSDVEVLPPIASRESVLHSLRCSIIRKDLTLISSLQEYSKDRREYG